MDYEFFEAILDHYMLNVTKIRPGIVTSVNYSANTVDVQPLIKTRLTTGQQSFSQSYDVPLMVYSAKSGNTRITIPIKAGDKVIVLYSDRDYGCLMKTNGSSASDAGFMKPHGEYAIMAIPCFYTADAKPIDTSKIVIENGSTYITVDENGKIEAKTTSEVYIDSPKTKITGDVEIDENLHVHGGFTVDGYSRGHGAFEIDGLITSHTDVVSNVSLNNHTHTCYDGETSGPH